MGTPIWYCVTEECRGELRSHLPKNWHPPRINGKDIDCQLEDIQEIDKIMRQKPAKSKDD